MAIKRDPRRSQELKAIHVGRKKLGWDEETYRAALVQLTGKRSSAELTGPERARVLDRMRDLGFQHTKPQPPRRPRATQDDKIRALWEELDAMGALRDGSERALQAFVQRQTGKSRIEWCTPQEKNKVIEGLKSWADRVGGPVITPDGD